MTPQVVPSLQGHNVSQVRGGQHHALALTQVHSPVLALSACQYWALAAPGCVWSYPAAERRRLFFLFFSIGFWQEYCPFDGSAHLHPAQLCGYVIPISLACRILPQFGFFLDWSACEKEG